MSDLMKKTKASIFSEKIEKLLSNKLTTTESVLIRRYVTEAYDLGYADGLADGLLGRIS